MTNRVVEVRDLKVHFRMRASGIARAEILRAVDGVSFDVQAGETLGLVGESGSGKTTTGLATLGLVKPTDGTIRIGAHSPNQVRGGELRRLRSQAQMIFQDPYSSLDPSMTIGQSLEEPLIVHTKLKRVERRRRVEAALDSVSLPRDHADRFPGAFSGGQRQRIAIARAMILEPRLVVCDEPVSSLDVSTQGSIINLLRDQQDRVGCAYLFIAHDIAIVRAMSDRIGVMYLGKLVEDGPSDRVCDQPAHPYTAALMSAVAYTDPRRSRRRERIALFGEIPSPISPPSGCSFHPRCPLAMDICRTQTPTTVPVTGGGQVSCHLHTSGPMLGGKPLDTGHLIEASTKEPVRE